MPMTPVMNNIAGYPDLRYTMGFGVGNIAIPDPTRFTGAESALDTMGERDATGYLHRNMVATKYPLKMAYENIPWVLVQAICALIRGDKFNFTFPDPFNNTTSTIEAYAGDREFECVWAPESGMYLGSLKFSIIQY